LVQLLELLNKFCDLAVLIEARFSRGYAKPLLKVAFSVATVLVGAFTLY
jgi:hypothetical protein